VEARDREDVAETGHADGFGDARRDAAALADEERGGDLALGTRRMRVAARVRTRSIAARSPRPRGGARSRAIGFGAP